MAKINGFFGHLSGPFQKNIEIFNIIETECSENIDYISKLGIHWIGNFDLDLNGDYEAPLIILIKDKNENNQESESISFQIGKTRMLELEDVRITSIQFTQDVDDRVYIDYQYVPSYSQ